MASSLLGLAPGGGYLAICITADAGGLLHHVFTITLTPYGVSWLFVSVALVRQVSSSRRVPRPGCYPTPCSVECGLSSVSTTQDRDRPTDLRKQYHTRERTERQRQAMISNNSLRGSAICPLTGEIRKAARSDPFLNFQISLEFFIKDIKIRIENVTRCRTHV